MNYASIMPNVAKEFWGTPNKKLSTEQELRWGEHGSRSVNVAKGTFYDHESGEGGGVLDLLRREGHGPDWLIDHGFGNGSRRNGGISLKPKLVKAYDYHDAAGTLIFQVCRYEPKTFRQRRPDGRGGWIWNLKGVTQLPYHLAELIEAVALERPIFVVEGEKDVETLMSLGMAATTNAGGTKKWKPEFAEFLAGADVVIIPDNDDAGRDHAQAVARSATGKAARVRILKLPGLPPKGDVTDWFAAGGGAEAFNEVVAAAPEWRSDDAADGDATGLGEWNAGCDDMRIAPRAWLLRTVFCRGFLSSLLGDGGVGKTALRYAQLLSLATGRALTGDHVFQRCRVLIVSLEDGVDELRRRVLAVMIHYGISLADLDEWLFLAAPGRAAGKLMVSSPDGRPVVSTLAAEIDRVVAARRIDIVSIDPFVKSHSLPENSNSDIDEVMSVLAEMAIKHNIAIDVPHHVSKGPADPGNANRGRGASSMKDGARRVHTLAGMSTVEASNLGVAEELRRRLIRMDSAKVNIAPPLTSARWFRLVGVPLGNGNELYPNGDEVQTVEPWEPPNAWAGLSYHLLNVILDDIDAGLPDGNRYSEHQNVTMERAAWRVVTKHAPDKVEADARDIIKTWVKNAVLVHHEYKNPVTSKTVSGLRVDNTKRPT